MTCWLKTFSLVVRLRSPFINFSEGEKWLKPGETSTLPSKWCEGSTEQYRMGYTQLSCYKSKCIKSIRCTGGLYEASFLLLVSFPALVSKFWHLSSSKVIQLYSDTLSVTPLQLLNGTKFAFFHLKTCFVFLMWHRTWGTEGFPRKPVRHLVCLGNVSVPGMPEFYFCQKPERWQTR